EKSERAETRAALHVERAQGAGNSGVREIHKREGAGASVAERERSVPAGQAAIKLRSREARPRAIDADSGTIYRADRDVRIAGRDRTARRDAGGVATAKGQVGRGRQCRARAGHGDV